MAPPCPFDWTRCMPVCEQCVQRLALSSSTEGSVEAIARLCSFIFHLPSILLIPYMHSPSWLGSGMPPRRLRRRCFHQISHLSWTPFLQCRVSGCMREGLALGSRGWETTGKELPSVDFCIYLSGTCLFYNSGMTFFQESKYVFVLTLKSG